MRQTHAMSRIVSDGESYLKKIMRKNRDKI